MNARRTIALAALLFGLAVAWSALAGSVYLNGVRIDGVTNQKFEKVTISIDGKGDLYIEAPGYAVKGAEDGAAVAPSPKVDTPPPTTTVTGLPSRRYWLVKEENDPGKTQYDVDIYLNSVWFKRIRSGGEQTILEITKQLHAGPNVLHFAATKNIGQQRKSFSPQVFMRIIIGEGDIGGNNVMIENPLVQYKRTADETANFNDEYTIQVR